MTVTAKPDPDLFLTWAMLAEIKVTGQGMATDFRRLLLGRCAIAGLLLSVCAITSFMQPRWLFDGIAWVYPGALFAVELPPYSTESTPQNQAQNQVIALTIDDGPSTSTLEILKVLARYDAKATFFDISGHLPGHESALKQTLANGHELGNHLTADEASIVKTPAAFEADLLAAEQRLWGRQRSATAPRWLRPGMGWYSPAMVNIAQRHGYCLVLGSVFPYDTHLPSSRFASAFILATVQPGDIIVLHEGDHGRSDRTVQTLLRILPALQARGYRITTVGELSRLGRGIGWPAACQRWKG